MVMILQMLMLAACDLIFAAIFALCLLALYFTRRASYAVVKRNFVGYFNNPTGYVFICLFVFFSSIAAFWPHEFFTANLANLDQLNLYLPYIMLVFIPAITMSIWAEEKRQGTDELLLTLPANDFDIVMGKYVAAAAIFTVSLLFSQIWNFGVLVSLTRGDLDLGLFYSTYFGYWMMGLAMLAIGMVASFLTSNLTVGFILGALFNAPFVFASRADVIIPWEQTARVVSHWSLASQFDDFGRGVISISSITYFLMVTALGLYLSMVLIGARHWSGGRDGSSLVGHYAARTLSLMVLVLGVNVVFSNHDFLRLDVSSEKVSSLSDDTLTILDELEAPHRIYIDAFVGADVPDMYMKTKYDLLTLLKEFEARAGSDIVVRIHDDLEPFSDEVARAEEQFGIRPQEVRTEDRGTIQDKQVILGAAFTCGLQKVVIPFFDYGIPVEYELIRSINTVAQTERKRLGVVRTDAQLFGGFTFAGGQPQQIPKQAIVEELEKQYDVEEVDPLDPIDPARYDVLLVVQPSSLSPEGMQNLIDAIEYGVPTAIFEDPLPQFMQFVPGTGEPKQAPGGMMGMGGGMLPKADIRQLWRVLGIEASGTMGREGLFQPDLVWQAYNPYPKLQISGIPDEWVFVRKEAAGGEESISDNRIVSGLDEIFLPFPGYIEPSADGNPDIPDLGFEKLLTTGTESGTIGLEQFMENQADPRMLEYLRRKRASRVMAAVIRPRSETTVADSDAGDGEASGPASPGDETESDETAEPERRPLHVVYVSDIDLMIPAFLRIRARPDEQEDIRWQFENVTFVLNVVDSLSGDDAYMDIRKRKVRHATLKVVEERVQLARQREYEQRVVYQRAYDESVEQAEADNRQALAELQALIDEMREQQARGEEIDEMEFREKTQRLAERQAVQGRRLAVLRQRDRIERDRNIDRIRLEAEREVRGIQNSYKAWAFPSFVIPSMMGVIVFVRRRLREREGISRARLR